MNSKDAVEAKEGTERWQHLLQSLRQLRPRETPRFWVALIVSVLISLMIEQNWDSFVAGDRGCAGLAFWSAAGMYQQLVTAGPRSTTPRYTAIVDIRPGVEPDDVTLLNICNQRLFIARLVDVIRSANPSVVVLDKFFGPTTCDPILPGTAALREAIARAITAGTPVVVGRRIDQDNDLRVFPALSLEAEGTAPIEGYINLTNSRS